MPKILLVDDELPILQSTQMLLQQMGYDVVATHAADQIVPLLQRERPDLLLQDVRMPGLDLSDLVRRIRSDGPLRRVPIVLFSASLDLHDLKREVDVQGVIEKPFRPAELCRVIDLAAAAAPTPMA